MASSDLNMNVPKWDIDKIILVHDETYTAADEYLIPATWLQYMIPIGIYSTDGDVTWQDLGQVNAPIYGYPTGYISIVTSGVTTHALMAGLTLPDATGDFFPVIDSKVNAYFSAARYSKISVYTTFTVSAGSGTVTHTIPHSLGYVPFVRALYVPQTGSLLMQYVDFSLYKLDSNNVYFTIPNQPAFDQTFYCLIYED